MSSLSAAVLPSVGHYLIFHIIIHQTFLLARDWSKHITWANITQLKLGNIQEYPPILKTARVAKKIWRIINTIASIWHEKYGGIFVLGHNLFLEAHSFPRATLSENYSLLRTDNVRGQISQHIFAPIGGYCLFILLCGKEAPGMQIVLPKNMTQWPQPWLKFRLPNHEYIVVCIPFYHWVMKVSIK